VPFLPPLPPTVLRVKKLSRQPGHIFYDDSVDVLGFFKFLQLALEMNNNQLNRFTGECEVSEIMLL